MAPGPGNYNPYEIRRKEFMNKTDPSFWKAKHETELKEVLKKDKVKPDPALYNPSIFGTFENYERSLSNKKSTKPWGSASRFSHYEKSARSTVN